MSAGQWFATGIGWPNAFPRRWSCRGSRDAKTPYGAALRHIEALRKAGPVQLFTDVGGGHLVLWADSPCNADEVMQFLLGEEALARCVSIHFSH